MKVKTSSGDIIQVSDEYEAFCGKGCQFLNIKEHKCLKYEADLSYDSINVERCTSCRMDTFPLKT